MPDKRPSVKNEKQYEALKDKGMSKERAARIANSPATLPRTKPEPLNDSWPLATTNSACSSFCKSCIRRR